MEVMLDDFIIDKRTHFGTIKRSTGQDKVYVKNDLGVWKHCGYLSHGTLIFQPLVGVPRELVSTIGAECARQKAMAVVSLEPLPFEEPKQEEEEYEDEE